MSFSAAYCCIHCGKQHEKLFESSIRPLPLTIGWKCDQCGCTKADRTVRGIDIEILLDKLAGAVATALNEDFDP